MGKRIKIIKALDDGFNVNYNSNDGVLIRMLLDKKGLNDYNVISYKVNKGISEVVNALFKKDYYFTHEDLINEFKKRNEPFFKWMLVLNKKEKYDARIWAEINQKVQSLGHKTNLYLLGLDKLEYHHISKTKLEDDVETVKIIPEYETIWFYDKPLDDLIDDILIRLKEKGLE